ncbi:unnamed protein product [Rhizophagus irregularis]|nr:unnamed protein product [Rhizophagus irregularis]CAB4427376.1 unnamed protein product [Rhizophagus irregularis]
MSVPLETLDIHSELDTSSSLTTTPYLALTVHNHPKDNITSTWVSLLVRYTVIICWNKKFLRLTITKDSNNNLIYTYEDYEDDISLTNCIYKSSQQNFFYGNIINIIFSNLFAQIKKHYNAIITTNRIKNKMKRKARSLFSENLENDMPTPTTPFTSSTTVNINSDILVSSNDLPMTPKSIQTLVCKYASELNEKKKCEEKVKTYRKQID